MQWEVDAKAAKRLADDRRRRQDAATSSSSPPTPTAKAKRSPGTCCEILEGKKVLKGKPIERVVFNAVTKEAILEAMRNPARDRRRRWSTPTAPAARSTISSASTSRPCCGASCPARKSAGRVQSVALRIVCDRELEIEKFVAREYWSILAHLKTAADAPFTARLVGADGTKIQRLDVGTADEAKAFQDGARRGEIPCRRDRVQARQAAPLPAVHHLDAAAGSLAQARPRAGPHDAARPAAL